MSTLNKFKRTSVAGQFRNVDLPSGSDNASAYFQRDVEVGGDIHLGTETLVDEIYTNTGGNICFNISGVAYQITPVLLTQLVDLATTLSQKSDISYVDAKVAELVDSSPATLNTLNELASALGDDPNFATTVSNSIGLKSDTSYVNTQLNLKANISVMNSALATKLSNNVNSAMGAYLHFANNAQSYTEHGTQNFGSISVNKFNGGGFGEMDFTHNGWGMSTPSTTAFLFRIATSNTTFNELLRINKNGDAIFTGNITSPTITTIIGNIALKENTTTVDSKLLMKEDIVSVDSKLLLKEDIVSVDSKLLLKEDIVSVDSKLLLKEDIVSVDSKLLLKEDIVSVDSKLLLKDDIVSVDSKLLLKDDITSVDSKLLLKDDITSVDSKISNLQSQINAIELGYDPSGDISGTNISFNNITATGNLTISGTIINPDLSAQLATKSDTSAVNAALALKSDTSALTSGLALKADTSVVNAALALKSDTSVVNTALALKADTSVVNTALALKANQSSISNINNTSDANKPVSTIQQTALNLKDDITSVNSKLANKLNNNANSSMGAYLHFASNAQSYTEYDTGNFGSISVNKFNGGGFGEMDFTHNGWGMSNPSTYAFLFRIATSNTTFNELMKINKNGDTTITGTITSPTITTINSNVALKTDKTYTDNQLALKANQSSISNINNTSDANKPVSSIQQTALNLKDDITSVNSKLANKLNNNVNSAIGAYLHFTNNAQSYTEYNSQNFGSISVNKFGGGGFGEMDFTHNGWGMSSPSTSAFLFRIATSNTTFNDLLGITKNGNILVTGTITSPTITGINTNIALKEDTTAVNAKLALKADLTQLALKDDITSVNTKLALKSNIESPVFTGIVSAPIYQGNVSRSSTTSPVVFTASTLPAVIFKDAGVSTGSFGIPDMPIGTKFTVVKTCPSVTLYSTSGSVFFYTNRTSPFWQGTITFNEDSRTFIRAEIFTTTTMSMVQVWLTESSYSYSFNNNVLKSMVGAYFLDGGNNGINSENMRPIICSTALFSPGNSDDGYIINEGFSMLLYPDSNYGGTPISLSNYNLNEDPKPVYYVSPMVNNMQSLKLYYNLVEVTILNIS